MLVPSCLFYLLRRGGVPDGPPVFLCPLCSKNKTPPKGWCTLLRARSFPSKRCQWQMKRGRKRLTQRERRGAPHIFPFSMLRRSRCIERASPLIAQTIINRLLLIFFARFAHAKSEFVSSLSFSPLQNKKDTQRVSFLFWSGRRGSNSLPRPWQGRALPDELRPQNRIDYTV